MDWNVINKLLFVEKRIQIVKLDKIPRIDHDDLICNITFLIRRANVNDLRLQAGIELITSTYKKVFMSSAYKDKTIDNNITF